MSTSDKKEFLEAYHKIHDSLVRFCIVKSRGIMDPNDLVHDVLLVGLENYSKIKNKQALLSFLFTTANNICLNKIRRKKFAGDYHQKQADNLRDHSVGIEEKIDLQILYAALDELPELQKEALVLFEISDLPIKEIMEIQASKESAVKQRIKRGREKLVSLLKEDYAKETALVAALLLNLKGSATENIDLYFAAAQNQALPMSLLDATEIIQSYGLSGSAALSKGIVTGTQKLIVGVASFIVISGAVLFISNKENANSQTHLETAFIAPAVEIVETVEFDEKPTLKSPVKTLTKANNTKIDKIGIGPQAMLTRFVPGALPNQIQQINLPPDTIDDKPSKTLTIDSDRIAAADIHSININDLGEKITISTWKKEEILIASDFVYNGKKPEDDKILAEKLGHIINLKDGKLDINSKFDGECTKYISLGKKKYSTVTFPDGQTVKYRNLERTYTIHIPERLALELNAKNAEIDLNKSVGKLSGSLFQSTLNAGNIQGDLNLEAKYSTINVGNFTNAKLEFMQSTFNFGNGNNVDINTKYSTINGATIHDLNTQSMQTTFNFQSVTGDIDGDFKYSNLTAATKGAVNATTLQCDFTLTDIKKLTGSHKYSNISAHNISEVDFNSILQVKFKANIIGQLKINSSKYSKYSIQNIAESIDINSLQDKIEILSLSPTATSVVFSGKYSDYDLTLNRDAKYDFNYTGKYSQIQYNKLNFVARTIQDENNTNIIQGLFNQNGANQANLSLNCFQGTVELQ